LRVDDAKAAYDASIANAGVTGAGTSADATANGPAFDPATLEKLQKQLAAAQTAKSKTEEKIAAARDDPEKADKIPAFEAALAKTQDKIKDLAKQIASEKKAQKAASAGQPPQASPEATADTNTATASSAATGSTVVNSTVADKADAVEALKKKILAQSDRLDKARERLNMAQQQNLDTVDALQKAVDKQTDKLAGLEAQLATELNASNGTQGDV
ncbi:MAG: hypothetical protein AAFN68_06105, partial [Pseudomonadota bacterium]